MFFYHRLAGTDGRDRILHSRKSPKRRPELRIHQPNCGITHEPNKRYVCIVTEEAGWVGRDLSVYPSGPFLRFFGEGEKRGFREKLAGGARYNGFYGSVGIDTPPRLDDALLYRVEESRSKSSVRRS